MSFTNTALDSINDCSDLFEDMMRAYYLIYSSLDAIETRWGEERLIEHISFLINEYNQKMQELAPAVREALKEASKLVEEETLEIQKNRLDEVYKTNTVG
jgi:hypothetical protein